MNKILTAIDELSVEFKTELLKDTQKDLKAASPIAFWLSQEYKDEYDRLQTISGQKFGKIVQEVIKKTIDSVK